MTKYTITVFESQTLQTPLFGGSNSVTRNINISYDTSKLSLVNATIRGSVAKQGWAGIIKADFWLYVDGNEVWHEGWVAVGGERTFTKDVTDIIRSPKIYTFKAVVQDISANSFLFSVYLDLDFTEFELGATPTLEAQPIQYMGMVQIGLGNVLNLIAQMLPFILMLIFFYTMLQLVRGFSPREKEK
jgi:hypothetical protein